MNSSLLEIMLWHELKKQFPNQDDRKKILEAINAAKLKIKDTINKEGDN